MWNCNKYIKEFVLNNFQYSSNVAFIFLEDKKVNQVDVHPAWYQIDVIQKLNQVCESVSISQDKNYNVLNYPRVIMYYMELKNSLSPLMEGEFIIDVIGSSRYLIKLSEGKVKVTETQLPYDIALPYL